MNRRLEELLANLPPDLQREVEDFAAFLANRPREGADRLAPGCGRVGPEPLDGHPG